jgi:predicted DNA-binding transcriptional regulator AlpA
MSSEPDQISEPRIDPLLGQPRMVADPRISVAQAAEILGKTTERIYRLIQLGQLPRHGKHGKPRKSRQLLRSDVLRLRGLGEPISIGQAARRLRGSPADVRRLIADGKLTLVPGSRRLLYPADVQRIARTWSPPASESQPSSPAGQVNTPAAARILGRSVSGTRRLAAAGRIPAHRDDNGHYWYRPEHLDVILRAERATEEADHIEPASHKQ